jgi:hypothetical protein
MRQHKENINFQYLKLTKSCLALIIGRIMEAIYSLSLLVVIIIVLLGVILEGLMTVGKAKAR